MNYLSEINVLETLREFEKNLKNIPPVATHMEVKKEGYETLKQSIVNKCDVVVLDEFKTLFGVRIVIVSNADFYTNEARVHYSDGSIEVITLYNPKYKWSYKNKKIINIGEEGE